MNRELMEAALRKKEEILSKLKSTALKELKNAVEEVWIPYSPRPVSPRRLGAVDGGQNTAEFKGFTLYGISGTSILFELAGAGGRYVNIGAYTLADVDILYPPSARDRISLLRETLEGEAGYLSIREDVDLLLMDGSLRSVLIAPRPLVGEGRSETLEETMERAKELLGSNIFDRLEERVRSRLKDPGVLRESPFTAYTLLKEVMEPGEEVLQELFLLEYVEKLVIYKELISASLPRKTLYFISKRGRAQNYFGDLAKNLKLYIPSDMMLFQYMTRGPGYSLPLIPELGKSPRWRRLKWLPPFISGLNTFFGGLNVAITYLRLSEGAPVIKVEIPVIGDSLHEDDVRRLMDFLAPISAGGYPYPLYEVDRLTRIPDEDMIRLCRALGLNVFSSGREVVGEWRT